MLVNFIGAPCSGKTTIASGVFAALKEQGLDVEFLTERAREHIARKRYLFGSPILNDQDQYEIMLDQADSQKYLDRPSTMVVCDSDPLLTMLYMSEDFRKNLSVVFLAQTVAENAGVLFYCPPLPSYTIEGNRIHDAEFASQIDRQILPHYKKWINNDKQKIVTLPLGSVKEKVEFAISKLYAINS